jgi:DNA-binding LacI/PurR family transcriptional regulator
MRNANLSIQTKQASIKDIARMAGVAHSTVSRALRNSPLVNSETTERIQRIAREAGYRTSLAARSLVTRRSDTIGVVVTNIADPFVAGVVSGVEETADQRGLSVFLANCNAEPEREVRVARKFEERRVDGIIVTASRVGAQYVPLLTHMQVPIVLLNNQHPSQYAHSVMIANVEASLTATWHLIQLGHRRIAYLGDRCGYQSDAERQQGYRRALQEAGISLDPLLLVHGNGKPEGAESAMAELLDLAAPPTAVFCYNDMSALGALRQIRERGMKIPGDISIIGFDDIYFSQYLDPPMTTVRQPMRQMGRIAMETLFQIFEDAESRHDIRVPGELIVRKSTAPPKKN